MKYNSHRLLKHTLSLFYILGNRCPQYVFCFSTQIYASLEHTKIGFLDENARIYNKRTKLKISRNGKSQIIIKENQTRREEKTS